MSIKKKLGYALFYDCYLNPVWRSSGRWKRAKERCLKRDRRTCQACGSKKHPEVHHIANAKHHKDKKFLLTNLVTLCKGCHRIKKYSFHRWWGSNRKKCTLKDFKKWLPWAKKQMKLKTSKVSVFFQILAIPPLLALNYFIIFIM